MTPITFAILVLVIALIIVSFFLLSILLRFIDQYQIKKKLLKSIDSLDKEEQEKIIEEFKSSSESLAKISKKQFTFIILVLILTAIFLLFSQTRTQFWISIAVYFAILIFIFSFIRISNKQRAKQLIDQLPNAIDLVIHYNSLNLPISAIIKRLSNNSPQPIKNFFQQCDLKISAGQSTGAAISKTAQDYRIFELDYFAKIMTLQEEAGVDIIKILRRFSELLRKQRVLRKKINAITMESRLSLGFFIILPIIVLLFSYFVTPEYFYTLFTTSAGHKLLLIIAALYAVGFLMLRNALKII